MKFILRSPDWKKRCCLFTKSLSPKRSVFSLLMLHLVVYVLMYYTLWCIYSADGLLTSEGKRYVLLSHTHLNKWFTLLLRESSFNLSMPHYLKGCLKSLPSILAST